MSWQNDGTFNSVGECNSVIACETRTSRSMQKPTCLNNNYRRSSGAADTSTAASAVRSSCKTMQRKLEQKVERTRNLLTQKLPLHPEPSQELKNPPIMPISRMRIPGQPDCLPLVDYGEDGRDEDDDEVEFYPIPKKSATTKHELSDTFSLQEMTICGTDEEDDENTNVDTRTGVIFDEDDDDDDDSQTLEFLSPKLVRGRGFRERCSQLFCCSNSLRF